jgi:hypothetical protein
MPEFTSLEVSRVLREYLGLLVQIQTCLVPLAPLAPLELLA